VIGRLRRALLGGTLGVVQTAPVTVTTANGALRGTRANGVVAFRGIPYAATPVGERRFGAPVPVPPWTGVRDATTPGATAPMPGYPPPFDQLLPNPVIPGDDYLNLTVWTPDPGARGLPVLVWIHGGAFVNGSNAVPTWRSITGSAPRDSRCCPTRRRTAACSTRSRRSNGCATTWRPSAATLPP
jgi:para-nitrobenzyl esterase